MVTEQEHYGRREQERKEALARTGAAAREAGDALGRAMELIDKAVQKGRRQEKARGYMEGSAERQVDEARYSETVRWGEPQGIRAQTAEERAITEHGLILEADEAAQELTRYQEGLAKVRAEERAYAGGARAAIAEGRQAGCEGELRLIFQAFRRAVEAGRQAGLESLILQRPEEVETLRQLVDQVLHELDRVAEELDGVRGRFEKLRALIG